MAANLLQLRARQLLQNLGSSRIRLHNAPHATTGVSPFFATRGYDPVISVHPDAEVTDLRARHSARHQLRQEPQVLAKPPWPSTRTETAWNLLPFALVTDTMSLPTVFARTEPPANSRRKRSAHFPSFPNFLPLPSLSASLPRYEFTRYSTSPNWSPNTPTRSTIANNRPHRHSPSTGPRVPDRTDIGL